MTDQNIINQLNNRMEAWSNKVKNDPEYDMKNAQDDPEFIELIYDLMTLDQDSMMVLVGQSLMETGAMPDWLIQGLDNDDAAS